MTTDMSRVDTSTPTCSWFSAEWNAAIAELAKHADSGPGLSDKERALLRLAVAASATTLYAPAIRAGLKQALAHGASQQEIVEVLQLVSVIGIHACTTAVPLLLEELSHCGIAAETRSTPERAAVLREDFIRRRGYWSERWGALLSLDPDFFEAFTEYSSIPWEQGPLSPQMKEFVYIAMDAACTHLYASGLRLHFRNALSLGASPRQLFDVICVASTAGLFTFDLANPMLAEEIQASTLATK